MKELIRQISLNCKERGDLLQKIWNTYLELFQKVILKNQKIQHNIENLYLKETTRIHQMYQKEIDNFYSIQENLKQENINLAKVAIEMKDTYKAGKKEKKASLLALKSLKKEYDRLNVEYKAVMKTKEDLIFLLEEEKKEVEEKKIVLDEFKIKNEELTQEKMLLSVVPRKAHKFVDTQDLTHFFNEETNTEERFLLPKASMFTRGTQTEIDFKGFNGKKPHENFGIFYEFAKEREKYQQKRASISAGMIEESNTRALKKSFDASRRSSNYADLYKFRESINESATRKVSDFDKKEKLSNLEIISEVNKIPKIIKNEDLNKNEVKLPKYVRDPKLNTVSNNDKGKMKILK